MLTVVGIFIFNCRKFKMSKKKSKKRQAIDKALEEMGITPVPEDHPIYRRGPSIRFITKKKKETKKDDQFTDVNSRHFQEFVSRIVAAAEREGKSKEEIHKLLHEFYKIIEEYNAYSVSERDYYLKLADITMGESLDSLWKFSSLSNEEKEKRRKDALKKLQN